MNQISTKIMTILPMTSEEKAKVFNQPGAEVEK
jgi:hypothetical protein